MSRFTRAGDDAAAGNHAPLSADVLVVGGGPAGTWAAIKAAQAGAERGRDEPPAHRPRSYGVPPPTWRAGWSMLRALLPGRPSRISRTRLSTTAHRSPPARAATARCRW